MKRIILAALCCTLLASPAFAQLVLPGSSGSSGGGGTPCTTTASSLQYDAAGSFGCVSGWTTNGSNTITNTQSIGATSTDGLILTNTTAAANGAQQWSPRLHFTGQGWKTTATAASETTDWIIENQPAQGSTTPSTNLALSYQINGGGYVPVLFFSSTSPSGSNGGLYFNIGASSLGFQSYGTTDILVGSPSANYAKFTYNTSWGSGTANGLTLSSLSTLCWTNGNSTSYCDTGFTRAAAATLQLGPVNAASPVSQTVQAQGVVVGTTSNGTGGNLTIQPGVSTGNATTSQLNFNSWVPVSSGSATQTSTLTLQVAGGAVSMPSLAASSAATTGTVCWTTGGNLTVDTTLACLASLEELKDIHGPINDAVAEVSRLEPFSFAWKEGTNQRAGDTQEQIGLGAHQVAAIDKRLVSYSDDGKLLGVRYQEMTALLVQAIKEQQAEIEELKRAR